VSFLDNVIDATPYFIDENKVQQQRERRVGLGIMGLAEMMIRCEVRYGSKEGNAFIGELGKFIASEAYLASAEYAAEKGSFPEFDADKLLQSGYMLGMSKNVRKAVKEKGLRNVTLLTVAPTGTTGTMVDTSTGIEPYFSWTYWRKSRLGMNEIEVEIVADYKAKHPETKELPPWFVTAMELTPEEHVRAQAALQRWVDSAISKTCNAPNEYTIDQTRDLYQLLYDLGCKGGTIYRDGSRDEQVLMLKKEDAAPAATPAPVKVEVPKPRKRSSPIMTSLSARQMTALGSCYVNTTYDSQFEPLEVFVTSGKAGSDVASLAEALGRVISVNLRLPSPTSPTERLAELAEQLNGIGGSDSVGFGRNKIKSLPDAVGKALEGVCKQLQALQHPGEPAVAPAPEPEPEPAPAPKKTSRKAPAADLCPACGLATYIREEGCRKCTSCGHSACG
jgi:ribonucleoside-diphosphate reductase alpha chain